VLVILDNDIKDSVEFVSSHKRRETVPVEKPAGDTPSEYERLVERIEKELKSLFGFEKQEKKRP